MVWCKKGPPGLFFLPKASLKVFSYVPGSLSGHACFLYTEGSFDRLGRLDTEYIQDGFPLQRICSEAPFANTDALPFLKIYCSPLFMGGNMEVFLFSGSIANCVWSRAKVFLHLSAGCYFFRKYLQFSLHILYSTFTYTTHSGSKATNGLKKYWFFFENTVQFRNSSFLRYIKTRYCETTVPDRHSTVRVPMQSTADVPVQHRVRYKLTKLAVRVQRRVQDSNLFSEMATQ